MRLRSLVYLYGWRLRAHPFQELLAGAGIAAGVALLFAVQVANTSITGSVEQLMRATIGSAQLQVTAGDEHGFPARTLGVVRGVDGVALAAPVLERRVIVAGPKGRQPLELFGVDTALAKLGGRLTRNFSARGLRLPKAGILLPDEVARAIGVRADRTATLLVAGRVHRVAVSATLGREQIEGAAGSPLAVASLAYAQRVTGGRGRITSIYVRARPGQQAAVRSALQRRVGARLDVGPADGMVRRLRVATAANDQSTVLFSAISAIVGVLFAFNAMLLTVPERRRFVAEMRTQGATPGQVVATLGFQALLLGVGASLAGLLVGDLLSRTVFHSVPGYLAFTFPIGTQRVVPFSAIALACGAGVVAALVATGRPLADVFARADVEAAYDEGGEPGEGIGPRLRWSLLALAIALAGLTTLAVTLSPSTAIAGIVVLIVATLLAMPSLFTGAMAVGERLATRLWLNLLTVAIMGTRAAMTRSIAVAAIAATAMLGNVAIGGAREDLVRGLEAGYAEHLSSADVWVTTAGRSLTTDSFAVDRGALARLRAAPGVRAVRTYQGGMFDVGARRLWIIARPPGDRMLVPASQLVDGDAARAARLIRRGGWVAVSAVFADDRGIGLGDRFRLRTPTGPIGLRVAAVVTNLSWGPGAIIMDARDYRRAWRTGEPSALEVDLDSGVPPAAGRQAVARALGESPALDVQTRAQLEDEFRALLHAGLTRLDQISTLMLIASALALAAAMSAAIWERRQLLATYKLEGVKKRQLAGMLLLEASLVLGVGCVAGALVGVYGHLLGNRWLELTTGFPAPFSVQVGQALVTLVSIVAAALAIVAVPGYLAARVPARLRFQE